MRRRVSALVAMLALATSASIAVPAALATPSTSGPSVSVDPGEAGIGDYVTVTMKGFTASWVTISFCGNDALRGSADCNMTQSQGLPLGADGANWIHLMVSAPPTTCPCIVRVSTQNFDEVAVAPIIIRDVPVGPLVKPAQQGPLVTARLEVHRAPAGVLDGLRPSLGGPTKYAVTLTVKNRSNTSLSHLKAIGAGGHNSTEDAIRLDFGDIGTLAVGQTWTQTLVVVAPSPSVGSLQWRATVSGAGPSVDVVTYSRHQATLLIVAVLVVIACVFLLLIRFLVSRHMKREVRRIARRAGAIDTTAVESEDVPRAA